MKMKASQILKNYIPCPFWDMDQEYWYQYVNDLKGDQRDVLSCYPFRWAFAPPHDAATSVQFLRDIGVDGDQVLLEAVEKQFQDLPTFEGLQEQGAFDENPPPGFRMVPEWERMAGVLLHWPVFYPPLWETFRQVVAALDHVTTFIRVPAGYLGAAVLAWLGENGIDLARVRPIPGPIGDIWIKDYAPLYGVNVYSGEPVAHKFRFAAYGELYRKYFAASVKNDENFCWSEGYRVYRTAMMMDGGYVQTTDGEGTYILTRRALTDNASIPNLHARLKQWLGAERLIFVDEQPGDPLGHINHFRFIAPGKVLVGRPEVEGTPLFNYLAKVRDLLLGLGCEVIDIPCPEKFDRVLPGGDYAATVLYANCLIVNERVIVSVYDQAGMEAYNDEALQAYGRAFPGYEIIPIDVSILANGGGGIYCSTREIPDIS